MKSPTQLLASLDRANKIIMENPECVSVIDAFFGKKLGDYFVSLAADLRKEVGEKGSAYDAYKNSKTNIAELSQSLRALARNIEDFVNASTKMQGRPEVRVHLQNMEYDLLEFEDFLRQLESIMFDFDFGIAGQKISDFHAKLDEYRKIYTTIDTVNTTKGKEAQDVLLFLEENVPLATALLSAFRELLRITRPDLYRKFVGSPHVKTNTSVEGDVSVETSV